MDATTIARSEEQSLADAALALAPHSAQIGSSLVSYSEPGSWLNKCWNFGIQGPVSADEVDQIIAFFDSHDSETRLDLATVADPSAAKALAGRGFELTEFANMLVADLTSDTGAQHQTHPYPTGLEIRRVDADDPESLDQWAELSTRGFNEGNLAPAAEIRTSALVVRYEGVDGFIATMDGKPAGAAALGLSEAQGHRRGGMFATSVLPQFRRLGIQQHLITARLERARNLGASFVTIGSRPGIPTERNASRCGFTLAYANAVMVREKTPD